MKISLKRILQYGLPVLLAIILMVYAFKGIEFEEVINQFKKADYRWILVSAVLALISHASRAYRWMLLVRPLGYKPTLLNSFLAVMNSYFINTILPRAGEITRCGVSKKLDKIPATTVFGTVVLERIVDMLMLLVIFVIFLIVEFNRLSITILEYLQTKLNGFSPMLLVGGLVLIIFLVGLPIAYKYRKSIFKSHLYARLKGFALNMLEGLMSIRTVKNKPAFIFHTVLIWSMYYLMAYVLFFCFPETSHLDLWFGVILLIVGTIGMAAPVQGGFGTYHYLVGMIFGLRGMTPEEGVLLATFMHTVSTFVILVVGGLSFLITSFLIARNKKVQQPDMVDLENELENVTIR